MTAGDTASDLTFYLPGQSTVPLSAFLDRPYLLLVFLRHLT
jgi:hypothetical protein